MVMPAPPIGRVTAPPMAHSTTTKVEADRNALRTPAVKRAGCY